MLRYLSLICIFFTGCTSSNRIDPIPNIPSKSPSLTYFSGTGVITASTYIPPSGNSFQCMCLIRDYDTKREDRFMITHQSINDQFGQSDPPLNTYEIILHCLYRVQLVENTFDPPEVSLLDCLITSIDCSMDGNLIHIKCDPPIAPNQLFIALDQIKQEKKNETST